MATKEKNDDDFEIESWNSQPAEASAGKTGSWRTYRPVIDHDECIRCDICALYCPDICITRVDDPSHKKGKMVIDYDYCKGCAICSNECPKQCIEMVKESEFHKEEE